MTNARSKSARGGIAQLVERLNGIEEVSGSNPLTSIKNFSRLSTEEDFFSFSD